MGGVRRYIVLEDAKAKASSLLASLCYKPDPKAKLRNTVSVIGYDHASFVACQGKGAGDFVRGSSLVEFILPESTPEPAAPPSGIDAPLESRIPGDARSPSFVSAPGSTALRLQGGEVCSMLTEASTTAPCAGLAFESWIKIDQAAKDSVIVAYKSTHSPRSERSPEETQSFVLSMQALGGDKMKLVGKANGSIFSVGHEQPTVHRGQWTHFACSLRNAFAMRFSGADHVDLGAAAEFNVSDFTLVFTLQLDHVGKESQAIFIKSDGDGKPCPLHVSVEDDGLLRLRYWAQKENGGTASLWVHSSRERLKAGVAYKVFVSRKLVHVPRTNEAPRPHQLVTMRAWPAGGSRYMELITPKTGIELEKDTGTIHGPAQGNEAPLYVGGAPWNSVQGLKGVIGGIALYSGAITPPDQGADLSATSASEKSLVGWWSCRTVDEFTLIDNLGRNNGRLKGSPAWLLSPYDPDHQLFVLVNGIRTTVERPEVGSSMAALRELPAGRHQLTLGNVLLGDDATRFMGCPENFMGEIDELRIWNTARTRENICDSMHTRLAQIPPQLAVYLPFDGEGSETQLPTSLICGESTGLLTDVSINCWNLTAIYESQISRVTSGAPIGHDAPCVHHVLSSPTTETTQLSRNAAPSVSEYGDMEISASGGMEGAYKRAYTYIDAQGRWCLVTGFRIGTLLTEWMGQVQTAPTLIGYIEGAPPLPVESFTEQQHRPSTSVRFQQAKKCTYSYSSRKEGGMDVDLSLGVSVGAKWEVSAGMGVETQVSKGDVKAGYKTVADISHGRVWNEVATSTTNTNMDMRVELTGAWVPDPDAPVGADGPDPEKTVFEPANTGIALVESEVADVFALRLQMRGPVAPLVAYQTRPNPDIPKDRNLVSFEINPSYTKQGCLDGRRGTKSDVNYPPSAQAPKDASYFKPIEAYALKDRIRRAEEQRQGEYDQYSVATDLLGLRPPRRVSRNICNSYVWTADGGTYQETHSTLDVVQAEVGGSLNTALKLGLSADTEVAVGGVATTTDLDAMFGLHFNLSMTKERTTDEGFDLDCDLPPPVDLRAPGGGGGDAASGAREQPRRRKRPGAVDCYRWMSFWLEPSVEATEVFFQQVLDPTWLAESPDPDAGLLRQLRASLAAQAGDARTKAWRVLHRCTYVSRVPEPVAPRPAAAAAGAVVRKSALLADVAGSWLMLQKLEPWARGVESRAKLALKMRDRVATLYPALVAQPLFYSQVLDLLGDYLGLL